MHNSMLRYYLKMVITTTVPGVGRARNWPGRGLTPGHKIFCEGEIYSYIYIYIQKRANKYKLIERLVLLARLWTAHCPALNFEQQMMQGQLTSPEHNDVNFRNLLRFYYGRRMRKTLSYYFTPGIKVGNIN